MKNNKKKSICSLQNINGVINKKDSHKVAGGMLDENALLLDEGNGSGYIEEPANNNSSNSSITFQVSSSDTLEWKTVQTGTTGW